MIRIILILTIIIVSHLAHAEYRVYQYYVKSKIPNIVNVPSYLVTSSLDPKSYVAYHGGSDSIEVSLLRSWMCLGNTAKTPVCTISDGKELDEMIATENIKK